MRSRNGKIARLPRSVRDQLNERLECSEPGPRLLAWLNALPEVNELVEKDFAGSPINKQNLSEWRQGGFQEWSASKDFSGDATRVNDVAAELANGDAPALVDKVATVLAVRFAGLLTNWDGEFHRQFRVKVRILNSLCRNIIRLQRNAHLTRRDVLERDQQQQKIEKARSKKTRDSKNFKCQEEKGLEMNLAPKSTD